MRLAYASAIVSRASLSIISAFFLLWMVQAGEAQGMSPAVWSHSISARYELNDSTTILAGIDNLADEKPFRTEYSIPVSAVGRSMFVRASMKF